MKFRIGLQKGLQSIFRERTYGREATLGIGTNKLPYFGAAGYSQGWLDTYEVQIIPFVANAFSIFLFYQFFDSIPKELDEAAKVDGAGWFRIYRSIVMPLSGPAIATVAILTFLPTWNQYLWPLMSVQTEELRPVMVGIPWIATRGARQILPPFEIDVFFQIGLPGVLDRRLEGDDQHPFGP